MMIDGIDFTVFRDTYWMKLDPYRLKYIVYEGYPTLAPITPHPDHPGYWKNNFRGYTLSLSEAGRYTWEDVLELKGKFGNGHMDNLYVGVAPGQLIAGEREVDVAARLNIARPSMKLNTLAKPKTL